MAVRRRAISQLRLMGYTVNQIAGRVGVSGRTVLRDLESIGQEVTARLEPEMIDGVVVDALYGYKTLHERAMADYATAESGSVRLRYLQMAVKSLADLHKFLKCMRLFPKGGMLDLNAREGDGE